MVKISPDLYIGDTGIKLGDLVNGGSIFDLVFPIGSIYLSVNSTNPKNLFGGTWELFGAGCVPVCIDTSDSDFSTVGRKVGSKTSKHSHSYTYGMRGMYYSVATGRSDSEVLAGYDYVNDKWVYGAKDSGLPGATGVNQSLYQYGKGNTTSTTGTPYSVHASVSYTSPSVVQPSIPCYIWKRTA